MKTNRSFLAYFQLVLLCAILTSNALFMHSHVAHGHLVMHMHPFALDEKGDVATHEHNDDEMVFYDFLAHQGIVHVEPILGITDILTIAFTSYQAPICDEEIVRYPYHDAPSLRGPPNFS
ncbi:hypothetical protein M8998_16085 [Sphingobacterium sp. lm-10]|uniref:hypothetical protein n=1 Tax=Sphingobacterium sp. lm-10 TaxID=2944904 RepID=UPI0020213E45|nr:hypothetical protein [Sphingobacterium sp. lm-10]MCL7989471.1 hypothetical protein [Sphingobacterium sp. lm-10]